MPAARPKLPEASTETEGTRVAGCRPKAKESLRLGGKWSSKCTTYGSLSSISLLNIIQPMYVSTHTDTNMNVRTCVVFLSSLVAAMLRIPSLAQSGRVAIQQRTDASSPQHSLLFGHACQIARCHVLKNSLIDVLTMMQLLAEGKNGTQHVYWPLAQAANLSLWPVTISPVHPRSRISGLVPVWARASKLLRDHPDPHSRN